MIFVLGFLGVEIVNIGSLWFLVPSSLIISSSKLSNTLKEKETKV